MQRKTDITNEEDVKLLVDSFYEMVSNGSSIDKYFSNTNWAHHKPRMYAFWEYVLLDKPAQIHGIYDTHNALDIKTEDFETWLKIFKTILDKCFEGPKANLAWQRAQIIAYTFNSKMNPGTTLNM